MADEEEVTGYRVTRSGDITAYRITAAGMCRVVYLSDDPPPPVPGWLVPVLRVRGMIYDPQAKDIVYVERLPYHPPAGVAFTLGGGIYQERRGGAWIALDTKFTDAGIGDAIAIEGDPFGAACLLIDRLVMRVQPDDYITSGNAGGQSVGFPSLADMLAFYRGLKESLLKEAARMSGLGSGGFFRTKRRPVGGVLETDDVD
jgi:hypothetical protein